MEEHTQCLTAYSCPWIIIEQLARSVRAEFRTTFRRFIPWRIYIRFSINLGIKTMNQVRWTYYLRGGCREQHPFPKCQPVLPHTLVLLAHQAIRLVSFSCSISLSYRRLDRVIHDLLRVQHKAGFRISRSVISSCPCV